MCRKQSNFTTQRDYFQPNSLLCEWVSWCVAMVYNGFSGRKYDRWGLACAEKAHRRCFVTGTNP